jgi:hypothetical protein
MSRLLIQGGASGTQEIVLKPGANRIGRNEQNDLSINDPTVSSFHCEIDFDHGTVIVRDLGSTNGTFINSVPIQQAILEPGQTLRLGSVELFFPPDAPASPPTTVSGPPPAVARVRLARADADPPPPPTLVTPADPSPAPPLRGPDDCRNHSGVPATLVCQQCGTLFCKSCVKTIHAGNRDVHSCLLCAGICVNLAQHRKAVAKETATFGSLLPTAFKYPLEQNGPAILLAGTILFTFLDFARLVLQNFKMVGMLGIAYWLAVIMSVGYLFAYMQNIIVASCNGEDNPPGWPEISGFWDDVVVPCLRCITIWLVCAGPGVAAMIFVSPMVGVIVLLLGLFCIPMAFLTVSLADSVAGLNPLLIFSSIGKVPGPYLIACVFFLVIIGLETFCESFFRLAPIFIVPAVVGKFVSLYGLTVEMRILGLLYYTNKEKLAWFG